MLRLIKAIAFLVLLFSYSIVVAQKTVKVAAPFLLIAPDSRSSAIGDAGVATSTDVYSMNRNPAKYAFAEEELGIGFTFTPLQRKLIQDRNLLYLSGFYRTKEREVIATSIKYYSLGKVEFSDDVGNAVGIYTPSDISFDMAYIRKLFDSFSISTTVKYINCNLRANELGNSSANTGKGVAAEVGLFYTQSLVKNRISLGIHFSNIGPKMIYGAEKLPLPTLINVGGSYTFISPDDGSFSMILEAGTPINEGMEGYGTILLSGLEYTYRGKIAVRAGYHNENKQGYFSTGFGAGVKNLKIEFSYTFSTGKYAIFQNTSRFGLSYYL
ncbi:PorV/PorQ family protein [Pedobacter sp. MW01-1-1]|uniref:PorV/PorQ family protein n=1 Tax=Pedobacter sp. MW01-1-1 TaxID=3383027 RepID=UPI003FF00268